MKLPFPYRIASEFYLFYPPKKLTLIHLFIPATTIAVLFILCDYFSKFTSVFIAIIPALLISFFLLLFQYRICCNLFKYLLRACDAGWIALPDEERLKRQITISSGKK